MIFKGGGGGGGVLTPSGSAHVVEPGRLKVICTELVPAPYLQSKKDGKDQESIQLSTTPDPGQPSSNSLNISTTCPPQCDNVQSKDFRHAASKSGS